MRQRPRSTLFPYTTLFRSVAGLSADVIECAEFGKGEGVAQVVSDELRLLIHRRRPSPGHVAPPAAPSVWAKSGAHVPGLTCYLCLKTIPHRHLTTAGARPATRRMSPTSSLWAGG